MSNVHRAHDGTGRLTEVPGIGVLEQYGTTLPTDGSAGYAPGCVFIKTNGSGGTLRYLNEGSATSSSFKAMPSAGTSGAGVVGILDTSGFTAQTTVEGALAEIYQDALSTKAFINVPLVGAILAAGTPMAAWADNAGASAPGITLANSKAVGLRWNNQGTQTAVWLNPIAIPADFDITANAVVNVLASKTGATSGDATTFTITAFNNTSGALHDADSDFGGATSAMTGAATAKTIQKVTLTLALADLAANPNAISMSIKPTDGTLGTDDVIVHAVYIEYKRKARTS